MYIYLHCCFITVKDKYMNTLVQITEKQFEAIDFQEVDLQMDFHQYTDKGNYYRLVSDSIDFEYGDALVRCFGFYASMTEGDKGPDVYMKRIELYMGEEEMEITPQQAYYIEQKVKQSIQPRLY